MIYDTSQSIVEEFQGAQDFEGFKLELLRFLSIESPINESEFKQQGNEDISEKVYQKTIEQYRIKSEMIAQRTYPVIKDVYENQSATYENIVIPFTDGIKTLQVVANLKESFNTDGGNIP